jgi:hypothetical protein
MMATFLETLRKSAFPAAGFDLDARYTYFWLRAGMGSIGALLPIVVVVWGLLCAIAWRDMSSISAFYWLLSPGGVNPPARDWFVGSLCAVGLCLIMYYGYDRWENWLLNSAGFFLALVALNPMPWPPHEGFTFSVHYAAAVAFFLLMAGSIWKCAETTLVAVPATVRPRWRSIYRFFSIALIAAPLLALAIGGHHRTILVEAFGIWVFSAYWIVKTVEIMLYWDALPPGAIPPSPSSPAPH